ncbi:MAG: hypothetical protein KKD39_03610, partial [Candidatus Altiarchaeota archaeon]|nr:hypothetical protein [Candidatus Altiarchaeota archaeon]
LAPKYSEISPHITKTFMQLSGCGIPARILHVPACFFPDFQGNIVDNLKMPQFTEDEGYWILKETILKNPLDPMLKTIQGMKTLTIKEVADNPLRSIRLSHMRGLLRKTHVKADKCRLCDLNKECSGVWSQYGKNFGLEELNPITHGKDMR